MDGYESNLLALTLVSIMSFYGLMLAHGVVGNYVCLEPVIVQDPIPANEDILQLSGVLSSDVNTTASLG